MASVLATISAMVSEDRTELWPRFTAKRAGVSTSDAREAMLRMAHERLLDVWYVVISSSGDEVERRCHPSHFEDGEILYSYLGDQPEEIEVESNDIYLLFSPTNDLHELVEGARDGPKKVRRDEPAGRPVPEELARSAQGWDQNNLVVQIENYYAGPVEVFDIKGGSGPTQVGGTSNTLTDKSKSRVSTWIGVGSTSSRRRKVAAGSILAAGILLALACAFTAFRLVKEEKISVAEGLAGAGIAMTFFLTSAGHIAAQVRG